MGLQPSTDDLAYDFDDTINDEFVTAGSSIQNAQSHALFAKGMCYVPLSLECLLTDDSSELCRW